MTAEQTTARIEQRNVYAAIAPGHYWLRIAFVSLAITFAEARGESVPCFPWLSS